MARAPCWPDSRLQGRPQLRDPSTTAVSENTVKGKPGCSGTAAISLPGAFLPGRPLWCPRARSRGRAGGAGTFPSDSGVGGVAGGRQWPPRTWTQGESAVHSRAQRGSRDFKATPRPWSGAGSVAPCPGCGKGPGPSQSHRWLAADNGAPAPMPPTVTALRAAASGTAGAGSALWQ